KIGGSGEPVKKRGALTEIGQERGAKKKDGQERGGSNVTRSRKGGCKISRSRTKDEVGKERDFGTSGVQTSTRKGLMSVQASCKSRIVLPLPEEDGHSNHPCSKVSTLVRGNFEPRNIITADCAGQASMPQVSHFSSGEFTNIDDLCRY